MPSEKLFPASSTTTPPQSESFESIARRMLESALALAGVAGSLETREIRECVENLAAHAKARGVQAERMIIELKESWYKVAQSGANSKSEVISLLVTMCIREFYRAEEEPAER